MNNEIKEILVRSKEQQALDDLKALANAKEDEEVYIEYGLNTKARILLDYITNLQECCIDKVDRYQKMILKYCELLEENTHLDKINCQLRKKINNDTYKSRNEKAIEYIKENICDIDFMKKEYENHFIDYDIETTFKDIENLLNILGGEDNE